MRVWTWAVAICALVIAVHALEEEEGALRVKRSEDEEVEEAESAEDDDQGLDDEDMDAVLVRYGTILYGRKAISVTFSG